MHQYKLCNIYFTFKFTYYLMYRYVIYISIDNISLKNIIFSLRIKENLTFELLSVYVSAE